MQLYNYITQPAITRAAYVWKGLAGDCGPWAKGGLNDRDVAERMVSVVFHSSGC